MTSYYYCIEPVLRHAETHPDQTTLISVEQNRDFLSGHREDSFVLANPLHMLRMDDPLASAHLAQLLEEVPLYHFNLKLLLDEALSVGARNPGVMQALIFAFGHLKPPPRERDHQAHFDGQLRHPQLDQFDIPTLSHIYIEFLMRVRRHKEDFSFQRNILGGHNDSFLAQFDGIFEENKGQIRNDILLAFGIRADHDPHKPFDRYVSSGQTRARAMKINEPHELLWAWLEADQYQARRAHDLHRVIGLRCMPRLPNWVRMDIYALLEREAMKNIFAERFMQNEQAQNVGAPCPALMNAVQVSARGQIDDDIHALHASLKTEATSYNGAGLRFHQQAQQREKESHNLR